MVREAFFPRRGSAAFDEFDKAVDQLINNRAVYQTAKQKISWRDW